MSDVSENNSVTSQTSRFLNEYKEWIVFGGLVLVGYLWGRR